MTTIFKMTFVLLKILFNLISNNIICINLMTYSFDKNGICEVDATGEHFGKFTFSNRQPIGALDFTQIEKNVT